MRICAGNLIDGLEESLASSICMSNQVSWLTDDLDFSCRYCWQAILLIQQLVSLHRFAQESLCVLWPPKCVGCLGTTNKWNWTLIFGTPSMYACVFLVTCWGTNWRDSLAWCEQPNLSQWALQIFFSISLPINFFKVPAPLGCLVLFIYFCCLLVSDLPSSNACFLHFVNLYFYFFIAEPNSTTTLRKTMGPSTAFRWKAFQWPLWKRY